MGKFLTRCQWGGDSNAGILAVLLLAFLLFVPRTGRADLGYFGVNLAGAEFGTEIPGTLGWDYTYPTFEEVDYYMSKGMNTFRLPFLWERMQTSLGDGLKASEFAAMDAFVSYATSKGASVILDPHDYGAYYGEPIDGNDSSVTTADFADFWGKLASRYKDDDHVIFGLMNEPPGFSDATRPGVTTATWLDVANAAISAIRAAGANNLILVPGNGYDGAWSWSENFYGEANATVMGGVVDSANNFAYEVHQYLDLGTVPGVPDYSGTETNVDGLAGALQGLTDFAQWLRDHDAKGFLGEFGVSAGAPQLAALDDVLDNLDENSDVWLGWTAWAGGPWWGDYAFSLEPDANGDKPQMAILEAHIAPIPEPGTIMMLALGALLGAGMTARSRRRRKSGKFKYAA